MTIGIISDTTTMTTENGTNTMNNDGTNGETTTTTNGSKTVAGLSPSKRAVYDAFVKFGPMTDDELVEKSGIKKSTSSPRRGDLVKLGLVESIGMVDSLAGKKANKWALVPPERIAEARSKASQKPKRNMPLDRMPLATRLEFARQLLDMDDVNDAIREQHGRAWSRLRGRANDRRGERNREMRENEAALREAQERGSPTAEYFKLRRFLMQSNERVIAVERLVTEELERLNSTGQQIPTGAWPAVVDLLTDLSTTCESTIAKIKSVMGEMGDDVIEGTVIDLDEFMLTEGEIVDVDVVDDDDDADVA